MFNVYNNSNVLCLMLKIMLKLIKLLMFNIDIKNNNVNV